MTGTELVIPVRNNFSGKKDEQSFDNLDKTLKRCLQAIEDWAESPFVSSAHIQDASITTAHIEDAAITTAKIQSLSVSILTSGTLTAETLLASTLRTGDAGERRVEIADTGVKLLDSSDAVVVSLPTDADQPAYFAGSVVASDFLVNGAGTIRGVTSVDINGGEVSIAASAATPSTAPALGTGTAQTSFAAGSGDVFGESRSRHALWYNSTTNTYLYLDGATPASTQSDALKMTQVSTSGLVTSTQTYTSNSGFPWSAQAMSMVYVASVDRWFVHYPFSSTLQSFTNSSGFPGSNDISLVSVPRDTISNGQVYGYLTTDGTNLFVAMPRANGTVDIQQWAPFANGPATLTSTTNCNAGLSAVGTGQYRTVRAFYRGSGDFGAARNVFMVNDLNLSNANLPGRYYVFNTAGARQASQEWDSISSGGLTFRAGTFYEMSNSLELLYQYGPASSGFGPSTYWVAYTFYDSNATGGTHESSLSPRTPFTGGARKQLQVTWPAVPAGGTDDPNSVRIYLKLAASDPGASMGDYFRQGTTFSGTNTTTLTTYDTSGGTPTPGTAFANSGSPGQLTSGVGGFLLKGDGTLVLPVFAADPGAGVEGQIYFNSVSNKFTGFDGTSWVALH